MKQKTRFVKSVIATAKSTEVRLPWSRDGRAPRAEAARTTARRA